MRLLCHLLAVLTICWGASAGASPSKRVEDLCREGRHHEAEAVAREAVERASEADTRHPSHAVTFHNLAIVCVIQGRTAEAERLYRQALAIDDEHHDQTHPDTAITLSRLAAICKDDARLAEAESLLADALRIRERVHGPDHPWTAAVLVNLADVHDRQGRPHEAARAHERALAIFQASVDPTAQDRHPPAPVFRHPAE
jgi:tetratricopeptide (TPR) repeat protein